MELLAQAWEEYHGGDAAAAKATCEQLLATNGDDVAALFLASLIDQQRGDHRAAIDRLRRVLCLRPRYAEAHNNLGNALAATGQLPSAEKSFRDALRAKPQYAEALNNLGNALRDQRKLDEAIDEYRRALQLKPDYAECHNNLGIALARKKRFDEAIVAYRRALAINPAFAEPQNNLGIVLAAQGRRDEASDAFRWAIDLKPGYVDALANLALTLVDVGRLDEAIDAYRRAIRLAPPSARLHNGLGIALARVQGSGFRVQDSEESVGNREQEADNPKSKIQNPKYLEEAVAAFQSAIEIDQNFAEAHNNLGNALRELGRLDEAETHLRRALALKSDYAEAHNNLGVALVKKRRIPEAMACYDRALRLKRDYAEAHLNRALAWLAAGDLRQGWHEYEWRWRSPGFRELRSSQPRWDGGLLDGKTILLWAEQGLGDTFQFIRYAQLVRQRGARVYVRAPRSLHALLSRTPGIDRLFAEDEELPRFDCHAPLASLPRLFATTLDSVPSDVPYLFPDEKLVAQWRQRLEEVTEGRRERGTEGRREGGNDFPSPSPLPSVSPSLSPTFRVGIAWQGNARFAADRHRSIPLSCLSPLADIPGVRLISLQKGFGSEQIEGSADPEGAPVQGSAKRKQESEIRSQNDGEGIGDREQEKENPKSKIQNPKLTVLGPDFDESHGAFMDAAAVMVNLDLVITSDTAIAHLAGGMGVPVGVLLSHAADWRWLVDGDFSPWYPTMRSVPPGDAGRLERGCSPIDRRRARDCRAACSRSDDRSLSAGRPSARRPRCSPCRARAAR
jgi:tetratricopeptide (TPR) repeat protein